MTVTAFFVRGYPKNTVIIDMTVMQGIRVTVAASGRGYPNITVTTVTAVTQRAVSYTHLDVYKRQGHRKGMERFGFRCGLNHAIAFDCGRPGDSGVEFSSDLSGWGLFPCAGWNDVGRILRTLKIKKNVEVTDNGKIII